MDENFFEIQAALANAIADVELGKNLLEHFKTIKSLAFGLKENILIRRANNENVEGLQNLLISFIELLNSLAFKIDAYQEEELPTPKIDMLSDLNTASTDFISRSNANFHVATFSYDIASLKRKLDSDMFESNKVRRLTEDHYSNLVILRDLHLKNAH